MEVRAIFGVNVLLSFVAVGLVTRLFVTHGLISSLLLRPKGKTR